MSINSKVAPLANQNINSDVLELSKIHFWRGLSYLAFDWVVILTSIYSALVWQAWWTYALAIILIASRQHALLVLVHEGAHFRLANNHKLNDSISQYFAAFPIFFCTVGYRQNHLRHHRHLNSMKDPDWERKIHLTEWQFPQNARQLAKTFLKILATSWYKLLVLFYNLSGLKDLNTYRDKKTRSVLLQKLAFYSLLGFVFYSMNSMTILIYFWLVPYLFVFPLIERVRSISEHFALPYADQYSQTRDVLCLPLEGFIFGPHNIHYHLVHHLYPSIPHYHLAEFRERLLKDPDFSQKASQNDGYFWGQQSVFKDVTNIAKRNSPERAIR